MKSSTNIVRKGKKTFDQDVKMLIKIGRKGKKRERAVKEILRFAQNDGESEVTDQNRQRG